MNGTDVSIFIMNQVAVNKIFEEDDKKKEDTDCKQNYWYNFCIKKRTELLKEKKFAKRKKK